MIKYHLTKNHTAQLLTLLATALLTVGCTAEGEGDELVEITPTMTINGMEVSATRAATDDGEAFYFSRCDEETPGSGTFGLFQEILKATRNSSTGALTFEKPQYYATDGRKCRFVGLYPQPSPGFGMFQGMGFEWTIDGTIDIMTAPYLDGTKTDKGINTFSFKHRLAQLQFFPFAETADVAAQWGKITKVEVLSQNSYTVFIPNDEFIRSGSYAFVVAGITDAAPFTLPTGGKASATVQAGSPCMIYPQTDAAYVLSLRITTEKLGVKTVTRTGALLENTPYRIYLRFTGQAIELAGFEQLNIEDWQDGYPKEVNSGRTYPYVVGGNTIVSKDADGQGANDIHKPWINNDMPEHDESSPESNSTPAKMEVATRTVQNSWFNEWNSHAQCPAPWRMPTLREAYLLFEYKDQLTGVDAITDHLLTATVVKNSSDNVWAIKEDSIESFKTSKATKRILRCVKDIE